jgi:hypothetical protein
MLRYKNFLAESIRQGLPHISKMDHKQLGGLLKGGKIHFDKTTEKTDGTSFLAGHDEHGFYTQSTGSGNERMRQPADYVARGARRAIETGKPHDPFMHNNFAQAHDALQSNKGITGHLARAHARHGSAQIRGELFHNAVSRDSDTTPGEHMYVGTSYDKKKLNAHGKKVGSFVVHSELPDNHHVNHDELRTHSDDHMGFEHDIIHHETPHLNVSDLAKKHAALNHDLLGSRTIPSNKEAKMKEVAKHEAIAQAVSDRVDAHLQKHGAQPKFGSGSEGLVVHPSQNPEAPRFKATSSAFRTFKKAGASLDTLRGKK